ncbi:MAG: LytR C-terminal domain-containing protein [Candidatus Latescibacteria bacterium]|jgi:hypothetical protein|nr:LytR C-terminal domain-containing protein [Candidatus Latescibacterota bacterium]
MGRFWWLLGLVAIVLAYLGLQDRWQQRSEPVRPEGPIHTHIRVEVLNGCGTDGIARKVGLHLRSLGFDVLTLENAESFNYPESIVIDRVGKPDDARKVAEALGIPNQIQQIVVDPFRIEGVTVIIGRDHRRLGLPPSRQAAGSADGRARDPGR